MDKVPPSIRDVLRIEIVGECLRKLPPTDAMILRERTRLLIDAIDGLALDIALLPRRIRALRVDNRRSFQVLTLRGRLPWESLPIVAGFMSYVQSRALMSVTADVKTTAYNLKSKPVFLRRRPLVCDDDGCAAKRETTYQVLIIMHRHSQGKFRKSTQRAFAIGEAIGWVNRADDLRRVLELFDQISRLNLKNL